MLLVNKRMGYSEEYLETHRETINKKRREAYVSADRKADYRAKREAILSAGKEDRANCPLCGLDFRRLYIPKHVVTRHKMSKEDFMNMCKPVV